MDRFSYQMIAWPCALLLNLFLSGATVVGQSEQNEQDLDYTTDEEYKASGLDTVARNQEFGERTVDNSRAFLRTQTPLLSPGQWQFDTGLNYTVLESDLPTIVDGALNEANIQFRGFEVPFGFRFGVTERLQWFGSTTLAWQGTNFTDGFTQESIESAGAGDLLTGVNFLLRRETSSLPSIIVTSDVSAPTGNARDPSFLFETGTGLGAWTTSTRILMIKSFDPVVAFWGAGYRWVFEDTYRGRQIDIGDEVLYTFGVGFGVNDHVTFSSALIGSYVSDLRVNSMNLPGTAGDVIALRLAATTFNRNKIIEPFVTIGLTERAPGATVGIIFTR